MSLPDSGRLVIQGPQGPAAAGDSSQAAPKKTAILLRMTAETLAALERDGRMDIDLTGQPKLYIGDACFTMGASGVGETWQELYLRMLQPNKPGAAPLKLQGNIVGRLAVERELDEKAERDIRERTQQAENAKRVPKIQLIDELPPKPIVKKLKSTKPTKSTPAGHAPTDPNRSATTSLQPSRVASQRPSPRPSDRTAASADSRPDTKTRLVHFVALRPCTTQEILAHVAYDNAESRAELQTLIPETLEKIPTQRNGTNPNAGKWQLKTASWLLIRPYEYEGLKPAESTSLARQARLAYGVLKIPQSDRQWKHVREPPEDEGPARRSPLPSTSTAETKKPMLTRKIKVAEATTVKREPVDSIATKKTIRPLKQDREATPTIPPAKNVARREPGSGFRAKSSSGSPLAGSPAPQPAKKTSPIPKREAPSPVPGSSRSAAAMPPPRANPKDIIAQDMKKKKEPSAAAHPDPLREKKRLAARDEKDERIRKRPRDTTESEYSDRDSVTSVKKRKLEEPRQVRDRERERERSATLGERPRERAAESYRAAPKERARERVEVKTEQREPTLPKKPLARGASPQVPPRLKASEREQERERERERERGRGSTPRGIRSPLPPRPRSPGLPPRPAAHDRLASVASNHSSHSRNDDHSSRNGSAKPRRAPSFTSSEDESSGSKTVDRKRRDAPRHASPPPRKANAPPRKLPADPEALRDLWDRYYPDYIRKHKRHQRLHEQCKRALQKATGDHIDIDFELPSEGELMAVREEARIALDDMRRIRNKYSNLTGHQIDES